MEKLKIFIVEVGVELKPKREIDEVRFDMYYMENLDMSLYDENIIHFTNKYKACEYIKKYVEKGIENTYGFMWEEVGVVDYDELETIKKHIDDFGYCDELEDIYFSRSSGFDDIEYFLTKEKVLVDKVYKGE